MQPKELGYRGEEMAAHFLASKGFEIIGKNFTVRGGEIDVIARREKMLVFVEVKTRTGKSFGHGDESFNDTKRKRLGRAIDRYLGALPSETDYRVDMIEIELDRENGLFQNLTHMEDIEL